MGKKGGSVADQDYGAQPGQARDFPTIWAPMIWKQLRHNLLITISFTVESSADRKLLITVLFPYFSLLMDLGATSWPKR